MQIHHTDGLCNDRGKKEELSPLYLVPEVSEALRCAVFNRKFIRETFNTKHTVRPESIARAVKRLFERDCAALAAIEGEAQDLFDRGQQLNYERTRLYNQRSHFCIQDNWLEDTPLMFSVKLGGPSNTMDL